MDKGHKNYSKPAGSPLSTAASMLRGILKYTLNYANFVLYRTFKRYRYFISISTTNATPQDDTATPKSETPLYAKITPATRANIPE